MRHILSKSFLLGFFIFISCDRNPYPQGKNLYTYYCANCHMEDGSGLKKLIPPINAPGQISSIQGQLPCIIKYGVEGVIEVDGETYNQAMAGFRHLSDAEISNIINFLLHKWAPSENPMLPGTVKEYLDQCIQPEPGK